MYELLWSRPISQVAPEFGISDVALAKACRKANIPLPPRGYWAKLRAGQAVEQVRLPDDEAADRGFRMRRREHDEPTPAERLFPQPDFPRDLKQRKEHFRAELGDLTITPLDVETHPELRRVTAQRPQSRPTQGYYDRQPQRVGAETRHAQSTCCSRPI